MVDYANDTLKNKIRFTLLALAFVNIIFKSAIVSPDITAISTFQWCGCCNFISFTLTFSVSCKKKQGPIHGYPGRVLLGRGSKKQKKVKKSNYKLSGNGPTDRQT